jgi:glycosyltransferase involved in cell wall biosynthesis
MNKKIRIGVWLSAELSGGGAFQYSLLTLMALFEMRKRNPEKYDLVCFPLKRGWERIIEENFDEGAHNRVTVKLNPAYKVVKRLLKASHAAASLWEEIRKFFPFAYRMIYKANLDLIICPAEEPLAYEQKVPTISTIHDLMHRYESKFPEAGAAGIFKIREKRYKKMCQFSKVILVDSQLGKQQVIESYGSILNAKVLVLPYLPPPYILQHNAHRDYSYVKEKYNLPDKYIFYPAQFWEHKNHPRLIKAIKALQERNLIVNAVFVGSQKNSYNHTINLIRELKLEEQVKILGYVPDEDMLALYKNCVALIMPTFFGPTNIPIVEALFLGVPVVCSNVYAMPEQVGEAGLLFNPNNIDDMTEKIYMIWTDEGLRKELVRKGFERIKDMTLENYAKQWEKIIETAYKNL